MHFQNEYESYFYVINVLLWDEPLAIPFLNNKGHYWDKKKMRQEKNIIIHIQSVYSYIPLDSSQYNVLCIISSIHVKCIQNLFASSSEIWIWYIQLSFKVISFLYYITIQPFFYSIHTEILNILLGPQYIWLFQERNKTELVKYHFWLRTYICLLPSYCRYDSFTIWLPF